MNINKWMSRDLVYLFSPSCIVQCIKQQPFDSTSGSSILPLRSVYSTRQIARGERIAFIPFSSIITGEGAYELLKKYYVPHHYHFLRYDYRPHPSHNNLSRVTDEKEEGIQFMGGSKGREEEEGRVRIGVGDEGPANATTTSTSTTIPTTTTTTTTPSSSSSSLDTSSAITHHDRHNLIEDLVDSLLYDLGHLDAEPTRWRKSSSSLLWSRDAVCMATLLYCLKKESLQMEALHWKQRQTQMEEEEEKKRKGRGKVAHFSPRSSSSTSERRRLRKQWEKWERWVSAWPRCIPPLGPHFQCWKRRALTFTPPAAEGAVAPLPLLSSPSSSSLLPQGEGEKKEKKKKEVGEVDSHASSLLQRAFTEGVHAALDTSIMTTTSVEVEGGGKKKKAEAEAPGAAAAAAPLVGSSPFHHYDLQPCQSSPSSPPVPCTTQQWKDYAQGRRSCILTPQQHKHQVVPAVVILSRFRSKYLSQLEEETNKSLWRVWERIQQTLCLLPSPPSSSSSSLSFSSLPRSRSGRASKNDCEGSFKKKMETNLSSFSTDSSISNSNHYHKKRVDKEEEEDEEKENDFELLRWAHFMLRSRGVRLPRRRNGIHTERLWNGSGGGWVGEGRPLPPQQEEEDVTEREFALIPFLDMLNHSAFHHNVTYATVSTSPIPRKSFPSHLRGGEAFCASSSSSLSAGAAKRASRFSSFFSSSHGEEGNTKHPQGQSFQDNIDDDENHHTTPHMVEEGEGGVLVLASRTIMPGEELTIHYGNHHQRGIGMRLPSPIFTSTGTSAFREEETEAEQQRRCQRQRRQQQIIRPLPVSEFIYDHPAGGEYHNNRSDDGSFNPASSLLVRKRGDGGGGDVEKEGSTTNSRRWGKEDENEEENDEEDTVLLDRLGRIYQTQHFCSSPRQAREQAVLARAEGEREIEWLWRYGFARSEEELSWEASRRWSSTLRTRLARLTDVRRRGREGEFVVGVPEGLEYLREQRQQLERDRYHHRRVFPPQNKFRL